MKFADRLVGKGLSLWVIFKLISFNLAWMVVLVVPMAVLVSTLMAFGGMAQNNEIAVLKSSGVSLYKLMIAPLIGGIVVALLLIHFNNSVYPDANHAARILLQDISKKKPTLTLVPGVFSQEVARYSILAREINPNSNELKNVTIYDNSDPLKLNTVTAEEGKISFSKDQKKLIMDLSYGEIHESDINDRSVYRKLIFERHRIAMEAEQFSFQQSSFGGVRGDREMSAQDMIVIVDSLELIQQKYLEEFDTKFKLYFEPDTSKTFFSSEEFKKTKDYVLLRAGEKINTTQSAVNTTLNRIQTNLESINSYWVEIHKKYSIPVACIIFILIGVTIISLFHPIIYIFGLILLYAAYKMAFMPETTIDYKNNWLIKLASRYFNILTDYNGSRFFVRNNKKTFVTQLFLALLLIESADIVFAIDSIPAVIAITHDPFIIITSNIFAILGLRALYFALAGIIEIFS